MPGLNSTSAFGFTLATPLLSLAELSRRPSPHDSGGAMVLGGGSDSFFQWLIYNSLTFRLEKTVVIKVWQLV